MVFENGSLLAESRRFSNEPQLAFADVDLGRLGADRMRQNTFGQSARRHADEVRRFKVIEFSIPVPKGKVPLERKIDRHPYVPNDPATRGARCEEVYRIQVQGLASRMRATGTKKIVIGVSGGLDSTQALIVCARAMDELAAARQHPRLHHARASPPEPDPEPGVAADAGGIWRHGRGDRHPPLVHADAEGHGHPYAKGKKVYDIASRTQRGERDQPPVPPRQPARRLRGGHRRPRSSRSAGPPTAWATTCRTTT
jgi:NAD+ synthase (glutamine-hydrolysing)